jgi:hypothetical protein
MRILQRWRRIVAGTGVLVPVAAVGGAMHYQEGWWWPLVALAGGAAASIGLIEIGAREERVETGRADRESRRHLRGL